MLLMKKWVDMHSWIIKDKGSEYVSSVNGIAALIVGPTSMTVLLVPTLELNIDNVIEFSGNFYQGLLECNVLCRHNAVLVLTTIALPKLD